MKSYKVSIIIPSFNRAPALANTLRSIYALPAIETLAEVILLDNGSTDNTKAIAEEYIRTKSNFRYSYDSVPGLLTGRHAGALMSNTEILAFIDDDVELSLTWLDTIIDVMEKQPEIGLMTGPTLPRYEAYPPEWVEYFWHRAAGTGRMCAYLSLLDLGPKERLIDPGYVWGLNFIIRKNLFRELNGFHPDCIPKSFQLFQGDGESGLTNKAREKGIKALYHPGALLYHVVPPSRLTFEYFDNRAFYQGVCDSYSDIRKANGLYTIEHTLGQNTVYKPSIREKIKSLLRPQPAPVVPNIPEYIVDLKTRFKQKEEEGYRFHQDQYNTNPQVKEWVLKQDYFNYQLPQNA